MQHDIEPTEDATPAQLPDKLAARALEGGLAESINGPLAAAIHRAPVVCDPGTLLGAVLAAMRSSGVGSMVVVDGEQVPLGIFTLQDLLNCALDGHLDLSQPVSRVMTPAPFSMPPEAPAFEAMLAMVERGFHHVLVVENGRLVGVVSERALLNLQRLGLRQISQAIRNAHDLRDLKQASRDIRELARNLLEQGVSAERLTQFISMLNDLLTRRIIELECAQADPMGIRFCWLALGSEGRREQTLSTDQDNGIIFADPADGAVQAVRDRLLPVAKCVNEALDVCGFPLCKGQIMASNPLWCLSLSEWRQKFSSWISTGDPEALLHASIFFDFRPVYGARELADALQDWLSGVAAANPRFLFQMAENALKREPPLGFWRDFSFTNDKDFPNTIDLKLAGITLFVDAARIYSLASGLKESNTLKRLQLAAVRMKFPPGELAAWGDAFYALQMLRLKNQQRQNVPGREGSNRIDPNKLNPMERHMLLEALRQAKKLQKRMRLDYPNLTHGV